MAPEQSQDSAVLLHDTCTQSHDLAVRSLDSHMAKFRKSHDCAVKSHDAGDTVLNGVDLHLSQFSLYLSGVLPQVQTLRGGH